MRLGATQYELPIQTNTVHTFFGQDMYIVTLMILMMGNAYFTGLHLSDEEEAVLEFVDLVNFLKCSVICQVIPQCVASLEKEHNLERLCK